MLQVAELRAPERDVYYRYVAIRGSSFAISILWSAGIATDWGVQSRLVSYIGRQNRSQLSILLAGHGYAGDVVMRPSDVVELDQARQDGEGYGGSPCEVLVIDRDDDGPFGPARRGPLRHSRIARHDLDGLRGLVARVTAMDEQGFVHELASRLGAIGLCDPQSQDNLQVATTHAARLFSVLGSARSGIEAPPSMTEAAKKLGLSERQLRRAFRELEIEYGMTTAGWREFVGDARLSWAQQLLSVPGISMGRVASLSGFGSPIALSHAFSRRARTTPGEVAHTLRERWR